MNTFKRLVASGALLGAYGYGALEQATPAYEPTSTTQASANLSPESRQNLLRMEQGITSRVGNLSTVELVILEGADTYNCPNPNKLPVVSGEITTYSYESPFYCWSKRSVVIGAGMYNQVQDLMADNPSYYKAFDEFVAAHEYSHGRQQHEGLKPSDITLDKVVGIELQADCMAGEILGDMGSGEIPRVRRFLEELPADVTHGTGEDRADAFMRGVYGQDCA
ncbi:MAG TPA: hypothetical protein VLA92_03500 [Candidatus Saccharimonadales bacterium]|nr:hypothetical protein [Candidatus Saccharimonadales bacterium]